MPELCAITTVFNPVGYRSRSKLYQNFRERLGKDGIPLYTVELVTGDREFNVTRRSEEHDIQLRSDCAIWHKENLINIALKRLPVRYDLVAWLDADIAFARPDWASATKETLERHSFVQMFSHVLDLGPRFEPLEVREGFVYRYLAGHDHRGTGMGQTGYAWAARRDVLEAVGGLLETSILGSNDYFMAHALFGTLTPEMTRMPGSNYAASLLEWQQRCERFVGGDVGYVDTTILHYWHGSRKERGYENRWRILVNNQFDPLVDLKRNASGLLELAGGKRALRDAIHDYFRSRNEDRATPL
jgi:hypothetical protein